MIATTFPYDSPCVDFATLSATDKNAETDTDGDKVAIPLTDSSSFYFFLLLMSLLDCNTKVH